MSSRTTRARAGRDGPARGGARADGAPIVAAVSDDWDERAAAQSKTTLDQVLYASHLLGANRALANYGGGNTSAKGTATDHVGREVAVMWVKGSGSDLATMTAESFTPLRLLRTSISRRRRTPWRW